jgi:hypothetical protein
MTTSGAVAFVTFSCPSCGLSRAVSCAGSFGESSVLYYHCSCCSHDWADFTHDKPEEKPVPDATFVRDMLAALGIPERFTAGATVTAFSDGTMSVTLAFDLSAEETLWPHVIRETPE